MDLKFSTYANLHPRNRILKSGIENPVPPADDINCETCAGGLGSNWQAVGENYSENFRNVSGHVPGKFPEKFRKQFQTVSGTFPEKFWKFSVGVMVGGREVVVVVGGRNWMAMGSG